MDSKPVRVVHILEGFLGGTSTYMCTVLPELVRRGYEVTLIGSVGRGYPDAEARISGLRAAGVEVHIIPMCREIRPLQDVRSLARILGLLSRGRFDIVHTHCSKAGALGRVAAVLTGRRARLHTPHCFAFMRCDGRMKRWIYLGLEKLLGRLTTRLVAVSESEASVAARRHIVPEHRCSAVRNGLSNGVIPPDGDSSESDASYRASLGFDMDTSVVMTACRLVRYKGIMRFLEAAEMSRAANTVFLVAGEGELRAEAERFVGARRLAGKVKLLGHVSNMERLYGVSDVVALCSDAEGQPYLLLEAMRARRPVVATSVIGNNELISHGKTGLLVEPTPQAIAEAIDGLLGDESKRLEYAANAYSYFREHHTLDRQISELAEVYRSVSQKITMQEHS
ncbi:MAG: glycosyltransferase family 4 protein [Phycisphaerales bacterium]|nr:MAG: glycosyltransferase family 4 protein [Phycisphaerales bacterium]